MKTLNLTFEDKEFKEMKDLKDETSFKWEDFIYNYIVRYEEMYNQLKTENKRDD